jgi:hypothetical protein
VGQTIRSQRIDTSAGQLRVSAPTGSAPAGLQWQPINLRQGSDGSWQGKARASCKAFRWPGRCIGAEPAKAR